MVLFIAKLRFVGMKAPMAKDEKRKEKESSW